MRKTTVAPSAFRVLPGLWLLAVGLAVTVPAGAGEAESAAARPPLSATAFLEQARRPFLEELWCRFTGEIRHRGPEGTRSFPLSLAMRLRPNGLRAELTLDGNRHYAVRLTYGPAGTQPELQLTAPPPSLPGPRLEELGLEPADLTFSFLYWRFAFELPGDVVRGQDCRVLMLENPRNPGEKVKVWFARAYAFPLRVEWFRSGIAAPCRSFEFSEFKRRDRFWFPKALRLDGKDWKSQVTFTQAEVWPLAERPEAADLFTAPAAPKP